jgi:hypothetical protein
VTTYPAIGLALVAMLATGVAHAQDISEPSEAPATPQTVCLIDEHLSVWLSLETADRMVALLEKERRELTDKLAKHSATLKLMEEGKTVSQGFTLTKTGLLKATETGGREILRETCDQIEKRLTEVSKTLKQRRMQRTRLEEWLKVYLDARAADGS